MKMSKLDDVTEQRDKYYKYWKWCDKELGKVLDDNFTLSCENKKLKDEILTLKNEIRLGFSNDAS
jgi:hypothetical protein